MIAILPIQPDILQMMAQDIGLEAEGTVWGYFAAEGTEMLGYIVVEKAEPVGAFTLEISTDVKTELYYNCRWTSVKREFSREGLRKTRKGIAMLRQEQEGE